MSQNHRDALVAHHVMEFKVTNVSNNGLWVTIHNLRQVEGSSCKYLDGLPVRYGYMESIPDYTTDISAAWEVVEKMQEHSVYVTDVAYFPADKKQWTFQFGINRAYASTMPEAICKAALKAVGVDIE